MVYFCSFIGYFAALTSILAKIGIEGVNSNLATAVRTIVVVFMAWLMVFITGSQNEIVDISEKKLDIFNFIRAGNWGFLALLL